MDGGGERVQEDERRRAAWALALVVLALVAAVASMAHTGTPDLPAALRGVGGAALLAAATWAWPRPGPGPRGVGAAAKARAIRHYQERARRYDHHVSRGPLRHLRRWERKAVLQLARLDDAGVRTVIDVGCGDGFYARAAKRAGKWVHAVDAAPGMIERVRPDVDRAEVADLEELPGGGGYDLVLCCGVLDFVILPEPAFATLCRLCLPGGRVVVLVPRRGVAALWYRMEKRAAGLTVNCYDRGWLTERARRHGLVPAGARYPLPTNMALAFERPPGVTGSGASARAADGPARGSAR